MDFDSETLSLVLDRGKMQRDLRSQLAAVITSTDALYSYLDGDGNPCQFQEMRSVQFEHRIYPDATTQHELMTSLINISNAMIFLLETVSNMREMLDDER